MAKKIMTVDDSATIRQMLNFTLTDAGFDVVTIICIIHNYAQLACFGLVNFSKSDDVWMIEDFENLCLFESDFSFFFALFFNVYLFDNCI